MYVMAGADAKRFFMDEKFVGWGGEVRLEGIAMPIVLDILSHVLPAGQ